MQNSYDAIELALFTNGICIDAVRESKTNASKLAAPLISALLKKNECTFAQLSFLAVNQGPAPFTTLRVIIATANGISFATKLPLIGVDGLRALLVQHRDANYSITIALLDAFNKDVYIAAERDGVFSYIGCENIDNALEKLRTLYTEHKLRFVGLASIVYAERILELFKNRAVIVHDSPLCSLEQLGATAYEIWQQQQGLSYQLFPLYLKHQHYKNQLGEMKQI